MKSQLRRQLVAGNKANLAMSVFAMLLGGALSIAIAFILKELIEGMEGRDWHGMYRGVAITVGYVVAFLLFTLIQRSFKNRFILHALRQYKAHVFRRVLGKSIGEFGPASSAKLLSAFSNDLNSIENNYLGGGLELILQIVLFVGALGAMLFLNPIMTAGVVVVISVPAFLTMRYGHRLVARERETSDKNEGFVDQMKDLLGGFVVIKAFKAEREVTGLFERKNRELEETKRRRRQTNDTLGAMSMFSAMLVLIVIFVLGAVFVIRDVMTIGAVLAFVQLSNYIIGPIERIVSLRSNFVAAGKLIDKLEETIEHKDAGGARARLEGFSDQIAFQNVSFAYEAGTNALNDVSFAFEKGKSYAIVGASGSGKSTMLKLLLGYSPDYAGSIAIDGCELRDADLDSLYDIVSVIEQGVFLFDESIIDNITLFKKFPQEKVERAVARAGLSELIATKGAQYDCGEGGANLSGGEKQRVSIARCLVRETPVLLMDEATAALDNATAESVMDAILDIDGLTRIIVTHKLDAHLMARYDAILVMRNGEIAETGRFDDLMERKGYFYSLHRVTQ
ncbi:MAG: ABC transporter ATP-binding protein [Christensenellales bacterium]|jgi:ATP-binding cassette subfamily B protein